jgi:hypothetical protein
MRHLENIKKLSTKKIFLMLTAKGLGGVGVGLLLAGYLPLFNYILYGWIAVVVSLIIGVSIMSKRCKK